MTVAARGSFMSKDSRSPVVSGRLEFCPLAETLSPIPRVDGTPNLSNPLFLWTRSAGRPLTTTIGEQWFEYHPWPCVAHNPLQKNREAD